jgi:hypothetical protein
VLAAATSRVHAAPSSPGAPEQRAASTAGTRIEPAVAIDPRHPQRVAVTAIELRHEFADALVISGYDPYNVVFVSDDGGQTYRAGAPLPTVDPHHLSSNDPTLWWSTDGTLYAGYSSFGPPGSALAGPGTADGAWVARSSDGGRHWAGAAIVQRFAANACGGPDKPMVTGDPLRPRHLFLVYQYLSSSGLCGGKATTGNVATEVRYASSVDAGRSWSHPRLIARNAFGPSAKVARDGSLLVAYEGPGGSVPLTDSAACANSYATALVATVAPGGTVRSRVAIPMTCAGIDQYGFNGTAISVHNLPTLEIDRRTGDVVVAVTSDGAAGGVVVARSTDSARHWTEQTLSDLPGTVMALPQLAAGPAAGLALLYLADGPAGTYGNAPHLG